MRVGGRLFQSELEDNEKHQVLIEGTSHLSTLLVRYHHHLCLHAGPQATLYSLRQQYWFINARNIVRRILQSCVTCARFANISFQPMMGPLPEERITCSKPFTHRFRRPDPSKDEDYLQDYRKGLSSAARLFCYKGCSSGSRNRLDYHRMHSPIEALCSKARSAQSIFFR